MLKVKKRHYFSQKAVATSCVDWEMSFVAAGVYMCLIPI